MCLLSIMTMASPLRSGSLACLRMLSHVEGMQSGACNHYHKRQKSAINGG